MLRELGVFFLFYIEEASTVIFLGLALFGVRPGLKKILMCGFLQAVVVFLTRLTYSLLGVKLGSHMIFTIIAMILILRFIAKVNWGIAFGATMLAFISMLASETLMFPWFLKKVNLTADQAFSTIWGHVALTYVGDLLMFILACVVGITGFSLIKTKS